MSVLRRSGRPRPSSAQRYDWGTPLPRSRWREALDLALFVAVFVLTLALAAHVGMAR